MIEMVKGKKALLIDDAVSSGKTLKASWDFIESEKVGATILAVGVLMKQSERWRDVLGMDREDKVEWVFESPLLRKVPGGESLSWRNVPSSLLSLELAGLRCYHGCLHAPWISNPTFETCRRAILTLSSFQAGMSESRLSQKFGRMDHGSGGNFRWTWDTLNTLRMMGNNECKERDHFISFIC